MASVPSYQYSALPDSKRYIRLLALSSSMDELHGSLETVSVSEAPPYEALSYACGDELPTSSLVCNSASLVVTPHLLEGVRQIRDTVGPTRLWIDAIRINQIDVDEKAGQIPLMTQIYSQTTRVLVWLGPAGGDSDGVMDEIWPLLDKLQAVNEPLGRGDYVQASIPAEDGHFCHSWVRFWSRSWFKRLWVLQEVVLARDILFVCGNRIIEFNILNSLTLRACRTGIISYTQSFADGVKGYMVLANLHPQRESWRNKTLHSSHLLRKARSFKVREPVDRMYALHGIMEDWIRETLRIDYSAEAQREYWRLYVSIEKLILENIGLDILSTAESYKRPLELPSWVPNWHSLPPTQYTANGRSLLCWLLPE